MPRGKYVNHKGRSRHFTNPEELEEELKKDEKKKNRSKNDSDEESENDKASDSGSDENENENENDDSEEESESEEDNHKAKGVSSLIQIENPNRIKRKSAQKITKVNITGEQSNNKPELSRREREELEKQRSQQLYQKLHAEGKTEQARADLARLAIIKQHRAEAAARREAEKKEKEERKKAATANR